MHKSRLAMHLLDSLVNDLFPNFSYNAYTQRFTRSPLVGRKVRLGASWPVLLEALQ